MQKKYSFFKTVKFENMPRILILLLKRFIFNIVELKNIKINNRVEFPDILEMNNYMIPNNSNKQNIIYNLKAIIIHNGESEQGHYFVTFPLCDGEPWVYILSFNKGKFYETDDEWGDVEYDDVTAWMPLPEPWKGADDERP